MFRKRAITAVLGFLLPLLTIELVSQALLRFRPADPSAPRIASDQSFDRPFYGERNGLLFAAQGKYVSSARSRESGQELYKVTYTIGSEGYRETPQSSGRKQEFVLFLGDSYTFGVGVADSDTLPAAFARLAPEFRIYNFAFGGYGPNDLLARADWLEAERMVKEKQGTIIYVSNNSQRERLLGGLRYAGGWGATHPHFNAGVDGNPRFAGRLSEARPWWTKFSGLAAATATVRYFGLDWPTSLSREHAQFYAKSIAAIRDRYQKQLPGARFLVAFSPGEGRDFPILRPELENLGIEARDFSGLPALRIPYDAHYTAETLKVFAAGLAAEFRPRAVRR